MSIKNKKNLYHVLNTVLQLQEHIETVAKIMCTKCGAFENDYDEEMLSEKCLKQGWKTTKNHCYCPDCANKFLKN